MPKLADVICQRLEQMILEGSLDVGQRLPAERTLAAEFDVSRPSLREALQKLEAKGLVRRKQGGGTYVCDNLHQSFANPLFALIGEHSDSQFDLLEFRHAVEGISAYYAALRGTPDDLAHIRRCYSRIFQQQKAGDVAQEAKAVVSFYVAISEAAHNVVMVHLLKALAPLLEQNIAQNMAQLARSEGALEANNTYRHRLLEAISNGQADNAREASHKHLAFIEQTLLDIAQQDSRQARTKRRLSQLKV